MLVEASTGVWAFDFQSIPKRAEHSGAFLLVHGQAGAWALDLDVMLPDPVGEISIGSAAALTLPLPGLPRLVGRLKRQDQRWVWCPLVGEAQILGFGDAFTIGRFRAQLLPHTDVFLAATRLLFTQASADLEKTLPIQDLKKDAGRCSAAEFAREHPGGFVLVLSKRGHGACFSSRLTNRGVYGIRIEDIEVRALPAKRDNINIGRDGSNDIILNSGAVSRRHLCLRREDEAWTVEDLSTTRGSALRGQPLRQRSTLGPSALLSLGDRCLVQYLDAAVLHRCLRDS